MRAIYSAVAAAIVLAVALLFLAHPSPSAAAGLKGAARETGDIPVPALADAPPRAEQGLMLTFESLAEQPSRSDRRSARLIALYVPAGAPPTPFLPAGPFRATWEGELAVSLRDEYIFSADGRGTISFEVNGAKVLDASGEDLSTAKGTVVKLNKGKNKIAARYESPAKGDAAVRMFWQSASGEFAREPLPIVQLSHDAGQKELRAARRLREGRELFATLRCARCHDAALPPELLKDIEEGVSMPELAIDAPSLADVGGRLNAAWMAKWIADPRSLRADATMPKLLHGSAAEKDAADIAGYLATLGTPPVPPPEKEGGKGTDAPPAEQITAGGVLLAKLGCIGCHTLPERDTPAEGRVPLRYVRAKWKPAALRDFLRQPDKHYAWIRMPNFRLTDEEIGNLCALILHQPIDATKGVQIPPLEKGGPGGVPDVARGQKLVESTGCLNCHSLGAGPANAFRAAALKEIPDKNWARGCMASTEDAHEKAPDFGLSAAQRDALLAFVADPKASPLADKKGGSLAVESLGEFAERQVKALRCLACHKRDTQEDVWSEVEQETAAFPIEAPPPADPNDPGAGEPPLVEQVRPSLTWTGEKLKPEWFAAFIGGKVAYKPRPWLHARMPGFPKRAALLAKGLVVEHGRAPVSTAEPAANPELAEIGRKLSGKNGGFSCTSCHAVGATAAVGVFEAPGINFAYVKSRLLKSYFHRWVRDPIRMERTTKMPTFVENGKSKITEYFGGDGDKQIEALWNYMLTGEEIVAPEE